MRGAIHLCMMNLGILRWWNTARDKDSAQFNHHEARLFHPTFAP